MLRKIIFCVLSVAFVGCSSPSMRGRLTNAQAKVYWKKFYQNFIAKCLSTKAVKFQKEMVKGKPYFYSCLSVHHTKPGTDRMEDPFNGKDPKTDDWFAYYCEEDIIKNFKRIKMVNRQSYSGFTFRKNHYFLKNKYTFLTIGDSNEWGRPDGRSQRSFFISIEGFSSSQYPTMHELHGEIVNREKIDTTIVQDWYSNNLNKKKRNENIANEREFARSRKVIAQQKAEFARKNREANRRYDRDFNEFRSKVMGAAQAASKFNSSSTPVASSRVAKSARSSSPSSSPVGGTSSSSNSRKKVEKCSRDDSTCPPRVVGLCVDSQNQKVGCFNFGTKFVNGRWVYTRTKSANDTCAQKMGTSNADARESWSPNKGFHSFKNHSLDPMNSCRVECGKFAKTHKFSCL